MRAKKGKRVAIASYGLLKYTGNLELLGEEVTFKISKSVLDKVGVSRDDLDSVSINSADFNDGITISIGPIAPAAGGYQKDAVRVENGGLSAVIAGYAAVASGSADFIMVASADATAFDTRRVSNFAYDAFFRRDTGIDAIGSSAIIANDYMHKYGMTEADFAQVAAKNYEAAVTNPYAHVKKGYSTDDILASSMISWPIREYECYTQSFGGAAILLASEEKAKELGIDPVWITGCGMGAESYFGDWDEIVKMSAYKSAVKAAYKMAGINNARQELDIAEVFNPFSPWELIAYEVLGLCEPNRATTLLRDGVTVADGELPVNVSGGTLCTHGANSSGLFSTIQAALYLDGELPQSRSGAKKAVVCDSDIYMGNPGASYSVIIIEKE